jgi:tetratricopeptide (TPR) repeat protein
MRGIVLFILLCFPMFQLYAQDKEKAEKLVTEGIAIRDTGSYQDAMIRFDAALLLDKDNLAALSEKAYTLRAQKKYDDAVALCKKTIALYPGNKELKSIYVTYGSSLDFQEKYADAAPVYEEGLRLFPDYYLLYFNKAINLSSTDKLDDALTCLQKSMLLNPNHAGTQTLMARVLAARHQRIPSVMAFCRFLILEPRSKRSESNLNALNKQLGSNVTKTGKNNITISISPDMLGDTSKTAGSRENDFHSIDLVMSLQSALDLDGKNKNKTEVQIFIKNLETLCSMLKETQKSNSGFYWDYYAPYFIELRDKKYLETCAYVIHASSDDKSVQKWLVKHKKNIQSFLEWSAAYQWKKN